MLMSALPVASASAGLSPARTSGSPNGSVRLGSARPPKAAQHADSRAGAVRRFDPSNVLRNAGDQVLAGSPHVVTIRAPKSG
jgi:hypothetical protein